MTGQNTRLKPRKRGLIEGGFGLGGLLIGWLDYLFIHCLASLKVLALKLIILKLIPLYQTSSNHPPVSDDSCLSFNAVCCFAFTQRLMLMAIAWSDVDSTLSTRVVRNSLLAVHPTALDIIINYLP